MAKYSPKTLQTNIYRIVSRIPKGKVLTYGLVAKLVGIKNPRLVGSVLHKNINPKKIPCHRVVNARGKVASSYAFGGAAGQRKKLLSEGIQFTNGKVDLKRFTG
ncbi:hypothetical protein A3A79_03760 [Candidatus Gottesmanbacteria bacterium RIFCSPLOWO2_01_FULL_43_11b]|uniref:Methylated-DNA-[protein]-cysteine S-methyltransferase DNA binding domain-containing protein n=1 Tax=Candidatus Gottesmanbacteria bacterium RIFCSPLOWO2_01_FULL_43_11b TaxID=1798392 RepID=A0A1F6AI39_9BACT|nr:MAG: hypothetical protein A3A79_03760 [Candidatus Gottesmanbacteria bacterium RIFCSPLOWO2_01_FULL_43_11b]